MQTIYTVGEKCPFHIFSFQSWPLQSTAPCAMSRGCVRGRPPHPRTCGHAYPVVMCPWAAPAYLRPLSALETMRRQFPRAVALARPTSGQTRKTGADLGQTRPKQLPGVVLGWGDDIPGRVSPIRLTKVGWQRPNPPRLWPLATLGQNRVGAVCSLGLADQG
jgi:hypothetical protein